VEDGAAAALGQTAARMSAGPPMSIISIISAGRAPRATVSSKG